MNEQPAHLRDDLLGARLKSALGTTPPLLAWRLTQLSSAGLQEDHREPKRTPFWLELVQRSAGMAVLLALPAALLPRFLELVMGRPTQLVRWASASLTMVSPIAVSSVLLPIGILLAVEALRGAPTMWRLVK